MSVCPLHNILVSRLLHKCVYACMVILIFKSTINMVCTPKIATVFNAPLVLYALPFMRTPSGSQGIINGYLHKVIYTQAHSSPQLGRRR